MKLLKLWVQSQSTASAARDAANRSVNVCEGWGEVWCVYVCAAKCAILHLRFAEVLLREFCAHFFVVVAIAKVSRRQQHLCEVN